MQNYKILFTALLLTATIFILPVKAQITIGDQTAPKSFSVLELATTKHKGGLRLPLLTTAERDALDIASNPEAAKGLILYNTDRKRVQFWNGTRWVSIVFPS
jgi:hypothetical protein